MRQVSIFSIAFLLAGCQLSQNNDPGLNTTINKDGTCNLKKSKTLFYQYEESDKSTRIYVNAKGDISIQGHILTMDDWHKQAMDCRYSIIEQPYVYIDGGITLNNFKRFEKIFNSYIASQYMFRILENDDLPPEKKPE